MVADGRAIGITEFLQVHEGPLLVLFALLTQLSDVWFLFLLGGVLYITGDELPRWGIDRRRGLFVLALVVAYIALIGVLKNFFLLPRPAGAGEAPIVRWLPSAVRPVFVSTATADGPGFPSGHAFGSVLFWGGLALVLDRWKRRTRLGIASGVVLLVSFSRLALGVHYAVDVVVGIVLGVLVLGAFYWATDQGTDPGRLFLITAVIGALGLPLSVSFDSVAAVGGAIGGWLVWWRVAEATPAHPTQRREVAAGFAVLGLAAGLFGVLYVFQPSLPLTFVGVAVAVGGTVGAPLLGERLT
ncbi:phosphatase PAP2 family protein [Haloarcula nitratireducens]|nr:phosphatase PAP2 family protein [Halomicroarcula nitratireducens]